jgi:prepilin-type N-terminal cleavage/methylation domain-containing protein
MHRDSAPSAKGGFTLIEVVVAIFVMGVAVSVGLSLYAASYSLARDSRLVRIAADLAAEQAQQIEANPGQFTWPALEPGEPRSLLPVGAEEGPQPFAPPSALPPEERSGRKALTEFEGFTWQAYASRPEGADAFAEVTVVVHWTFEGKPKHFTLTTLVARPEGEDLT